MGKVALSWQLATAAQTAGIIAAVGANTRHARFLVACSQRTARRGESLPHMCPLTLRGRSPQSPRHAHETASLSFMVLSAAGCLRVETETSRSSTEQAAGLHARDALRRAGRRAEAHARDQ